jgi:hypothetical protein
MDVIGVLAQQLPVACAFASEAGGPTIDLTDWPRRLMARQ